MAVQKVGQSSKGSLGGVWQGEGQKGHPESACKHGGETMVQERVEDPDLGKTKRKQLSLLPVPRVREHPMHTSIPRLFICGVGS